MELAFSLLLAIGVLESFAVVVFHWGRCSLGAREECQREVLLHAARHLVYALQLFAVSTLRFHGWALAARSAGPWPERARVARLADGGHRGAKERPRARGGPRRALSRPGDPAVRSARRGSPVARMRAAGIHSLA